MSIRKRSKGPGKKDDFNAKLSFVLSLGFWVPLFNIGLCIISIIIAIHVLRRYFEDPTEVGGLYYAISAFVISATALIMTAVGVVIYVISRMNDGLL